MIFSYLKLNNFLIYYGENSLVLPDPKQESSMTIILASNNSGKTTFIKALKFLLYGEYQGQGLRGLINHRALNSEGLGEKKAWVEAKVRLTENEAAQTIRRTITISRNGDGSYGPASATLGTIIHEPRGDKFEQDSNGSLQRRLEMKVPKALFDAYYFHGEPLAGQAAQPGQVGGVQAALEMLLHEDRWKSARALVDRARTSLNKQLSALAADNQEYLHKVEERDRFRERLEAIGKAISDREARVTEIKQEREKISEQQEELAEESERTQKRHAQRQELKRQLEAASKSISTADRAVSSAIGDDCGKTFLQKAYPKVQEMLAEMVADNVIPGEAGDAYVTRLLHEKVCICGRGLVPRQDDQAIECVERHRRRSIEVQISGSLLALANRLKTGTVLGDVRGTAASIRDSLQTRGISLNEHTRINGELSQIGGDDGDDALSRYNELQKRDRVLEGEDRQIEKVVDGLRRDLNQAKTQVDRLSKEIRDLEKKGDVAGKVTRINRAKQRAEELIRLLDISLDELKISIHSYLNLRIGQYFDRVATDGSRARVGLKDLAPYLVNRAGERVTNLGGGIEQLMKISYIISLSQLRRVLHEKMHELGLGAVKLDDQSFILDAPFSNTDGNYARAIADLLPGKTRQMVVCMFKEHWEIVRDKLEPFADQIYGCKLHTELQAGDPENFVFPVESGTVNLLDEGAGDDAYTKLIKIR